MFTESNLPGMIPVFPLPGAILLPRARLPLHIFEPRYLAMLDDTLKTSHRLIGMVQPTGTEGDDCDQLHVIGCAGRLTAFSETEDGRYMVTLGGISRFRLEREEGGFTPYHRFKVSWDGFSRDLGPAEKDPELERDAFLNLLHRFFQDRSLKTDWDSLREAEDELLINSLSMLCPFEPEDRQALLEAPTLGVRRKTLETLIEYELHGGSAEEVMQ